MSCFPCQKASWWKSHTWVISPATLLRTKSALTKKFMFPPLTWSMTVLTYIFKCASPLTTTRMCVKCPTTVRAAFFGSLRALTHVPPGKRIPSEGHTWCFCSQDLILFHERAPLTQFTPVRTDIVCLQLCWMMGQVFRRRVLKRHNDFSDWVPLKCKRNTLMNSHIRTRMSACVKSGTGNMTTGACTLHGHE